ncbi:GL18844 [Drosophila persimilis]|uniref:GL18844 n=1 Tax=Drosophila persimilis TaxID=7234 RepID=B4G8G2_DROPE|nr:GL18844 [Drosophila persimilis]
METQHSLSCNAPQLMCCCHQKGHGIQKEPQPEPEPELESGKERTRKEHSESIAWFNQQLTRVNNGEKQREKGTGADKDKDVDVAQGERVTGYGVRDTENDFGLWCHVQETGHRIDIGWRLLQQQQHHQLHALYMREPQKPEGAEQEAHKAVAGDVSEVAEDERSLLATP